MFKDVAFVFLSHHYSWGTPAFPEMAKYLTADKKQRINSLFFLLVYAASVLPIKLSLPKPTIFLTSTLPILPPFPL